MRRLRRVVDIGVALAWLANGSLARQVRDRPLVLDALRTIR
jgi:hypothetical protein